MCPAVDSVARKRRRAPRGACWCAVSEARSRGSQRSSKQDLAQELLLELAGPHIAIEESGDTREELLVGPVYFRLMFGGVLDHDFAGRVVDSVMRGYAA